MMERCIRRNEFHFIEFHLNEYFRILETVCWNLELQMNDFAF